MRYCNSDDMHLEAESAPAGLFMRPRVAAVHPLEQRTKWPAVGQHRPSAQLRQVGHRVGALTEVPTLLAALNVNADRVLASAGLTRGMLTRPEDRIDFDAFGRVMREGANASGVAHFGLMVGRISRLESLGAVGEVMRNCATLGEALQMLVLHQHASSAGSLAFVLTRAAVVDFGRAVYYPGVAGFDQILDATIAADFSCVRELVGPAWRPTQVFLSHAKPATAWPYAQLFGVKPRFDAEFCAMRFPAYWLQRPIEGASPARKAEALAHAGTESPGIVMQAHRGLRMLLLRGKCSGDDLAHMLRMHRRTLNRRLRDAGTTFQEVLDDVRYELARQLLVHTELGMDDIAAALTYASVSPFMRTFRRWSGMTPGECRRHRSDKSDRSTSARRVEQARRSAAGEIGHRAQSVPMIAPGTAGNTPVACQRSNWS